ncbi:MAG: HAD hydrolase-like protein [Actinomycetales bacterium]
METLMRAVLFDLDGTLVDPAGGITGGVAYALAATGIPVPDDAELAAMVGPKLSDSLLARTGTSPGQVPAVIAAYRDWYRDHGIAMGRPYPGIVELLTDLRRSGVPLGVATQKPQTLAGTVLAAQGLDGFFGVVAGSSDDETLLPGDAGYRNGKTEIIADALARLGCAGAVMVGDRSHDVAGALANGIDCLGAGWGFGAPGELAAAGAAAVVAAPGGLAGALAPYLEGHRSARP